MTSSDKKENEYLDAAGYPDGKGYLDEGTTPLTESILSDAASEGELPSDDDDFEIAVRQVASDELFEATIDGQRVAFVSYEMRGGVMVLMHTVVQPEFRGRGIADQLVADVLDDIRHQGIQVLVECPYVLAYLERHPEDRDVLA